MPVITRKERDKELRQQDFLRVAEQVFATKGFHKATMADIARQAEYGVGTIYLYYKDKQTLYQSLLEKKIGELFEIVKEAVKKEIDPLRKIETIVRTHMGYIQANREFFHILMAERGGIRGGIKDKIRYQIMGWFIKYASFIAGLIEAGIKEKKFRAELNPRYAASLLVGMMNATAFPQLREEKITVDLGRLSDFILDVFFNGVQI